jgi:pimeloyl-ACP methyl ester carboxylesterase
LQGDAISVATGLGALVDSCFHAPNKESMSYNEYTALVGAIAQQHPLARSLLLNKREQDQSSLLRYATKLPVLLIIGEFDQQILWEKVDDLLRRQFSQYKLHLVKDAGHSAFWEKAEETNIAIQSFIDHS